MNALIFQSDFGLGDGAVNAMYGVAHSVSPDLSIYDLTHDITPYDIWEASYRLVQSVNYWNPGTVFVSVVDPGVGSDRLSIVAKTKTGQYIVTPDNGTLTHLKLRLGIEEVRIIDESINRLANSDESYTFYGRDVYAYTGARLAAGVITFEEVGPLMNVEDIIELPTKEPSLEEGQVTGVIDILDVRFGSLWSNIPKALFKQLDIHFGDRVEVTISNGHRTLFKNTMIYAKSFADVYVGEALVYVNSLDNMAVAINQGSFARAYNIGTGTNWQITLKKTK
ncbi:SAM hydrolase/SAM-dependent halogenase family protein [Intestinibaculum porci]|uniref:DNA-directed RNA polymerase subunit delta n=1 Tax=Intestinibaculum porci TaxID=2487118 RepID=A0A3G9JJG7_9FIRM|nr:S-adenosyl-l-methionine hydroxide adenosyltransferase family protein [Intestinibaculum porci]MDD6349778.1 S-adenosyl-l-methionine hydroxide adenosyltransferase family protein [Intestinibaculum porci]MDD6422205.1 S-adenosyl-l-methionine hydroxide adenosyltransferase family protein [Intestinibaculum porci]BBH25133.1 DNA-directed RNA polymerase subunit delta [Intestinibaculum porci]